MSLYSTSRQEIMGTQWKTCINVQWLENYRFYWSRRNVLFSVHCFFFVLQLLSLPHLSQAAMLSVANAEGHCQQSVVNGWTTPQCFTIELMKLRSDVDSPSTFSWRSWPARSWPCIATGRGRGPGDRRDLACDDVTENIWSACVKHGRKGGDQNTHPIFPAIQYQRHDIVNLHEKHI